MPQFEGYTKDLKQNSWYSGRDMNMRPANTKKKFWPLDRDVCRVQGRTFIP